MGKSIEENGERPSYISHCGAFRRINITLDPEQAHVSEETPRTDEGHDNSISRVHLVQNLISLEMRNRTCPVTRHIMSIVTAKALSGLFPTLAHIFVEKRADHCVFLFGAP